MKRWGMPEEPAPRQPAKPGVSGLSAATAAVSGVAAAATGGASAGVTAAMTSLATDRAIDETVHTLKGFGGAFKSAVGRKLRELRGRRWERATERQRVAEANRRAADEVARRIEKETGKRPSAATVRRNARQDKMPRGMDRGRMDRQSRIDEAGGIKQFASQTGVNERAVTRWRDQGTPLSTSSVLVSADVEGLLWSVTQVFGAGTPYPRSLTVQVTVRPPDADEVRAAYAVGDMAALAELLGPPITEQVDWSGAADRRFEVVSISDITVTEL